MLATGQIGFIDVMNDIFPSTYFLVEAVSNTNIGAFLIYLIIKVIKLVVFMIIMIGIMIGQLFIKIWEVVIFIML